MSDNASRFAAIPAFPTTWEQVAEAIQIMRDTGDLKYKASRPSRKERSLHNTWVRNADTKRAA